MSKRKARMNRRKWWKHHQETVYSSLLAVAVVAGLFIAFSLVRG
jgi:hypothetical protein